MFAQYREATVRCLQWVLLIYKDDTFLKRMNFFLCLLPHLYSCWRSPTRTLVPVTWIVLDMRLEWTGRPQQLFLQQQPDPVSLAVPDTRRRWLPCQYAVEEINWPCGYSHWDLPAVSPLSRHCQCPDLVAVIPETFERATKQAQFFPLSEICVTVRLDY